jgi:hypothetical protein
VVLHVNDATVEWYGKSTVKFKLIFLLVAANKLSPGASVCVYACVRAFAILRRSFPNDVSLTWNDVFGFGC